MKGKVTGTVKETREKGDRKEKSKGRREKRGLE